MNKVIKARTVMELEQKTIKKKQRDLYGNDLYFDQQRLIYQQIINIGNFINGQQFLFRQLINHIRQLYPDRKISQDIRMYEWLDDEIAKIDEYGYDQETEIKNEIQKNKKQIQQKDQRIKKLTQQTSQLKQKLEKLAREYQLLIQFVQNPLFDEILKKSIKKMNGKSPLQQQLESTKKSFLEACQKLNEKIKNQILQFMTEYDAIIYEDKTLAQFKLNLTQLQVSYQRLEIDHSILYKNIQKLEDQIDLISEQINKQKNNANRGSSQASGEGRSSQSSSSVRSQSLDGLESSYKSRNPRHIYKRQSIGYEKQDKAKPFFYFLVIATLLLIIFTVYKKMQC